MSRPPKEDDYRIRDWREFNQVLGRRRLPLSWPASRPRSLVLRRGDQASPGSAIQSSGGPDEHVVAHAGFLRLDHPGGDPVHASGSRSISRESAVVPVLVFLGMIMGRNTDPIFSPLEVIAIVMAISASPMAAIWSRGTSLATSFSIFSS
jgi:hypothetical protein